MAHDGLMESSSVGARRRIGGYDETNTTQQGR